MTESTPPSHFIHDVIDADLASQKYGGRVATRFPPEPNGYLHIGHAKSICLNFGTALKYGGACHLRFDDTNPVKEDTAYVEAIQRDIHWLGFDWGENLFYASDYFEQLYQFAVTLIQKGKAYVCSLTPEQIKEYRGTLKTPGQDSPYRNRSVAENLDLFERMRQGEFADGAHALRAKINMASPNINMRDPVLYRIKKAHHHRTGDAWCIYPMYDFAHGLSDALEKITHSLCSLEFEDHRPLYDWLLEEAEAPWRPQQMEFARLNMTQTIMSKRYLLQLVNDGVVSGWDDPRMPTLAGLRRKGYPPAAIRQFCEHIGVAKSNSTVDLAMLEFFVREELNRTALRRMAVLKPLKVVLLNYPEGQFEIFLADNNPEDETAGKREVLFGREFYIEQDDFREDPPKGYHRLAPSKEVRLKHTYYITCQEVIKDPQTGEVVELHCTYDPDSRGGWTSDGRKVKGTLHWVSAAHAVKAEVRLYDQLLRKEEPGDHDLSFSERMNPGSLQVIEALIEPALAQMAPGDGCQFLRHGYFCMDADSTATRPVFNRTASLKDSWAKTEKKQTPSVS